MQIIKTFRLHIFQELQKVKNYIKQNEMNTRYFKCFGLANHGKFYRVRAHVHSNPGKEIYIYTHHTQLTSKIVHLCTFTAPTKYWFHLHKVKRSYSIIGCIFEAEEQIWVITFEWCAACPSSLIARFICWHVRFVTILHQLKINS